MQPLLRRLLLDQPAPLPVHYALSWLHQSAYSAAIFIICTAGMTIASPRFHACPKCAHLKPAAATAASTMPPMKLTCHDAECEKPEEPQAAAGSAGGRAAAGWWALELGSGTGASCVMMAQCGAQAVGVDCAPAAVAAAEELAAALGVGVDADGSSIGSSGRSDGSSRGSGRADGSSGSSSGRGCARFITHDIFTLPRPFTPHTACALHSAQTAAGQTTQSQLQLSPQAQDSAHGRQPQHSAEGFACSTKPAPAAGHLGAPPPDRLFDFIYDCQSFHVLRWVAPASCTCAVCTPELDCPAPVHTHSSSLTSRE